MLGCINLPLLSPRLPAVWHWAVKVQWVYQSVSAVNGCLRELKREFSRTDGVEPQYVWAVKTKNSKLGGGFCRTVRVKNYLPFPEAFLEALTARGQEGPAPPLPLQHPLKAHLLHLNIP